MKLRWRKRPSATVLHFSVLMTLGSALPLAISASSPILSMGARQPVSAVLATTALATAWFIGLPLLLRVHPAARWIQTVLFMHGPCQSCCDAKDQRNQDDGIFRREGVRRNA